MDSSRAKRVRLSRLDNGETLTAVSPIVAGFPEDSINSRINLAGVTVSAEK